MTEVNLIHKSDVYFDVLEPKIDKHTATIPSKKPMHHGEIYIYQNQIFLYDGRHWYRADIMDIKGIKSLSHLKGILIQFWDFNLILSCNEYPHLLALRDFLFLAHKNINVKDIMISDTQPTGGGY